MRTIDTYIDLAREKSGARSDMQLAARLNIERNALSTYRTKRNWPSDAHMVALAEMAGIDPALALMELNSWRTKDEKSRSQYLAILAKIMALAWLSVITISAANATGTDHHEYSKSYTLCAIRLKLYHWKHT